MKLSEAILKGSKISRHGLSAYCADDFDGRLKTCAMGAAGIAVGLSVYMEYDDINRKFPIATRPVTTPCSCPQSENYWADIPPNGYTLHDMVTHLNDRHVWSREAIALWVETIEQKEGETNHESRSEEHQRVEATMALDTLVRSA